MRTNIFLLGVAAALLASATLAQAPSNPFQGTTRFSGTVERLDGRRLTIETEGGATQTFELPDALQITESKRATMSDLTSGAFVGCTAVTGSDGKLRASECHIFPESMRGRGEGHNPMGPPNTTMTNGNIATMTNGNVQSAQGAGPGVVLHVTYKGGAQDIEVSKETQITRVAVGDTSLLTPGVKVNGAAREADGKAAVLFLNVTR